MKYCKRCILPDTRPNLLIGDDGVCNACKQTSEKPKIDWEKREGAWKKLVEETKKRSRGWDCVIPVSGGKDSTWQVVKALESGLKPLCVTWRTPARSELGQKNLDNIIQLGVDHIDFSINPEVEKKFTLEALKKKGSVAIPMHMALFAIPLQVAVKFKIPLVLWGENSGAEYGGSGSEVLGHKMSRKWLEAYGVTQGTVAEDWVSEGLSLKDLAPYIWPTDEELEASGVTAAFLGWYFPWDPVETFRVARGHGFEPLPELETPKTGIYQFADVDDAFLISIHHWLKWYKFGFTRSWDNLSLEIRNGRMSREEALEVLQTLKSECPDEAIKAFCKWVGISEEAFMTIIEKFRNPQVWTYENDNWKIKDFLIQNWKWA